MKYIHTFWSKPLIEKSLNHYNKALEIILSNYAYSANCIHKINETIELYADEYGAELLSFIPYDKVHIISGLENENKHFAAQIKFYALKDCELGDVLIDGDLFILKPKVNEIIKNYKNYDLIYSFYEPSPYTLINKSRVEYYEHALKKINEYKITFEEPYYWPIKYEDYEWINASLMCFNNQELKKTYVEQYFKHKEMLQHIDFDGFWPDIIIEQRFLTLLSNDYNKKALVEDFHYNPKANDKAIEIGLTHLGELKERCFEHCYTLLKNENILLYNNVLNQVSKYKK